MICEVLGKVNATSNEEQPLFSAEVTDTEMMEMLLLFYKRMGLIPGAEQFEITRVIPHGKPHQYHVPRLLISYGINSYRKWLAKSNPLLADLTKPVEIPTK